MYKAIVLLAVCAITSTNAYFGHKMSEKVNNRFALAHANQEQIRQEFNLGSYRKTKKILKQDPEADPETTSDEPENIYDCARGFAKGLQFSAAKEGACYMSLDESINAADDLTSLLLQAYNPKVWAPIMQITQNYMAYIAAIQSNCDIQKLIKTVTTDPTTLFPAMIARVGGGFIFEIPERYLKMKNAETCDDFMDQFAKLFSLLFDYYI